MSDYLGILFAIMIFVVASVLRRKTQPQQREEKTEKPDVETQWEEWLKKLANEEQQNNKAVQNNVPPQLPHNRKQSMYKTSAHDSHRTVSDKSSRQSKIEKRHKKPAVEDRHITTYIESGSDAIQKGILEKDEHGTEAYHIKEISEDSQAKIFVENLTTKQNLVIASTIFGSPRALQPRK